MINLLKDKKKKKKKHIYLTTLCCDAKQLKPDAWSLFFSSNCKFSVWFRFCAVNIFRMDWTCAQVTRLLFGVRLYHRESCQMQLSAAKHAEHWSSLCECVCVCAYRCSFTVNCKWIAEKFKLDFLGFKVRKLALRAQLCLLSFSTKSATGNAALQICSIIDWQQVTRVSF